jgi:hypothetical protein
MRDKLLAHLFYPLIFRTMGTDFSKFQVLRLVLQILLADYLRGFKE